MVNFDIPSAVERRKNDDKFFATRLWESLIKSIHSKELELTTRVIKDKRSLRSTKRTVVENCISGNDICDWCSTSSSLIISGISVGITIGIGIGIGIGIDTITCTDIGFVVGFVI
eukprot:Awhi_evm1s7339